MTFEDKHDTKELFNTVTTIIFDMDGLMIDSEPFHCLAFDHVFKQFGKTLTQEENAMHYVGISDIDAATDMVSRYLIPLSPQELVRLKEEEYKKLLTRIKPQPGLQELLTTLKAKRLHMVVASSSSHKEIYTVLVALGITSFFDNYFSAESVERGKPEPDLFLHAAKELHVNPSECLVLEDAPSGIKAAKQAGMKSIAIPSRETVGKDFSEATLVLDNLGEVMDCISD